MRKIIVTTFVSVDGVIQAPGGPDEDTSGGFELGGWTVPFWDDAATKLTDQVYVMPYDLLLGRRTYDIFASYWPNVEKDPKKPGYDAGNAKIGEQFDAVTKYVATHSPDTLTWQHSRWLGQNAVQAVKKLKQENGPPLLVPGSSNLVHALLEHRLVDELQLLVFPIVLGKGKRLFAEGAKPTAFKVTHSTTTPAGVMAATYVAAGDVPTGSFAEPPKAHSARDDRAHAGS
jgi:dihydrofolate reductase